ncbi:dihydroxyacetone kinase subunit DhaL [Exiguobacterium sp. 17-1]|uniref:dihydroxyacetone kinase subunit DhaL n=1 Tax=Exiguobacterium sp. 17-1 TaxID=2931981 RepID=UPI001FFF3B46|nr:dihydroxyacetone kinase subunit DhaL [Exiguobacterium sp. 17-1]MCK2157746.1 dihydroxyacetone kinase subunit L [Exiguobacterium sp. 17-1]
MKLSTAAFREALLKAAAELEQHKDELTDLDREIGDGDHGINMSRGFQAVQKELEAQEEYEDLGVLSKQVGMTLIKTVGGASGPLYGTAFVKFAGAFKGKTEVEGAELAAAFKEATDGIKMRGKSEFGQKTMVDVWTPFYEALEQESDLNQALDQALADTKERVATKGRASYFGDATKDVQDPGALSSSLLLRAITEEMS